ncbi:HPP family protein [Rhizobacter sp. AJA081-3]|uniref:CBS domain-containing protein n=1 Tax=Rhizobacter sp. AJA081-3 TaxID=2753607 RepID=UPI001AE0567E|nr:CBS domain-containing protein [Rhizobacter sp. AJA081-3]
MIQDIQKAVAEGRPSDSVSVRELIGWFGAARRGSNVNWNIRRVLEQAGLVTIPDFESSHIDGRVQFALAPLAPPLPEPVEVEQQAGEPPPGAPAAPEELPRVGGAGVEPAYRVSRLLDPRVQLVSVVPDATLEEAATLMLRHDFSQLPVMTNEREVRGIVSWESIGPAAIFSNPRPRFVRECTKPHVEVKTTDSLFRVINRIIESSYVLVRDEHRVIKGILTTTDLSEQFQLLAEPFLLLGEIENHIRALIDGRFTEAELSAVKDQGDEARTIETVADLTLGEHQRLLERPENWNRLGLNADRVVFVKELDKIRQLRNDVMHFDSDSITEIERTSLRNFLQFLHELKTLQTPAR